MNHSLLKKTVFSLLLACIAYISGYAASIRATSVFSYHPDSVRVILEEEQRRIQSFLAIRQQTDRNDSRKCECQ